MTDEGRHSKQPSFDDEKLGSLSSTLHSPSSAKFGDILSGVNVRRAEDEFKELNEELQKTYSRQSHSNQRVQSQNQQDLEKGADDEEPFDLEATLRGDRVDAEVAGTKFKQVGVLWKDLTVRTKGGDFKAYVKTFPEGLVSLFDIFTPLRRLLLPQKQTAEDVNILDSFRGVVKPGEMVLVLGRPGAGCTTFLKVISNQRSEYPSVTGEVLYGNFNHNEFSKRYRGEAVYNAEDESSSMLPTLTVRQTLNFALDTKVPGHRPAGISRKEFKNKVINMLLRMFNIKHTADTLVGGPFVRGISGGERKRVAIAEMMVTNAAICAWDNPTRGLDASTAVDYVRSIRVLSNIHKTATFVTAYQVSETIYREFDKVIVIEKGRLAFFGAATEARGYFEDLGFLPKPRQTTADYLTGCTDPHEREYKPELVNSTFVPRTGEDFSKAFDDSRFSSDLDQEIQAYRIQLEKEKSVHEDFLAAIKQSKRQTSARDVYSIPLYLQIWALMKRQFILKKQDTFSLTVSWTTCLLIAMLISTVWVNQPLTSSGAFTRGGVVFISFLFNGFQAFGELVGVMLGRPIVSKHRAYTFYRPSALWIGQIFVDLAFQSVVITAFCIMVYFSVGLAREPGAFFTFWLTILTGYLNMTLIFRTIGILCRDFDIAIRSASVMITFLILTSGYPIQHHQLKEWLRWIFWINPVGLGFSSLMINEFKRINLRCVEQSLIPGGQGYTDINHQVCTLLGSRSGNVTVPGMDYLHATFGYTTGNQWRNYSLIVVLIIFFLVANILLGEIINWGRGGAGVTIFAKETKETKKLNEKLCERSKNREKHGNQAADIEIASKSILTWEGLNYDVPVKKTKKRILQDVFGYVKPGTLTALMGASGAGKTTLLDVLAARKNIGIISGSILIDGQKPQLAFQRGTAYAEQLDVHEPSQSVREAFRFSADLRQPYDVPQAEKYAYVEEIISLLELEDFADAIIGPPEAGLSPDKRKLVTIGVELAAKPQLLLFLDEPTSGLDSQSAWNIARFLRKLTAAGQAVLCTM